jgi:hypothetical protein
MIVDLGVGQRHLLKLQNSRTDELTNVEVWVLRHFRVTWSCWAISSTDEIVDQRTLNVSEKKITGMDSCRMIFYRSERSEIAAIAAVKRILMMNRRTAESIN